MNQKQPFPSLSAAAQVCLLVLALPALVAGGEVVPLEAQASFEIVAAAKALLAAVPEQPGGLERMVGLSRAASLRLPFDHAARDDWSYWPRARAGLALGEMNGAQRAATQRLLASALSAKGMLKVMHIVQLERVLQALDQAGLPRELGDYRLVLFGQPSLEQPWGWRFEGHHVSINLTVTPHGVSATPSFLGANPGRIDHGPLAGFRVLRLEEDLGRALVRALDEQQRNRAVIAGPAPGDVVSGTLGRERPAWQAWKGALAPDGIAISELDDAQRAIAKRLLDEVLGNHADEVTAPHRERLDVNGLRFAWLGSTEPGKPHYYRLQSGDFVFEYDNVQGNANHIHTVWRDRSNDFGEALLARHYRDEHARDRP